MLIYRCDRCGKEHVADQIVGNEFLYLKTEFMTLNLSIPGVKDLCGECFKLVKSATLKAEIEAVGLKTRLVVDVLRPLSARSAAEKP
jgi:hypothetical protein